MEEYKTHVIDQGLTILRAHENIKCIFPTHRLLEALCEKIAARVLALDEVRQVRVAARKPHAPIEGPLDYVEVVLERARPGDA